ncbi:hypothetical protein NIES4102_41760 (plasmid) [Chondrocystis sp. NIES-4102]|nr:hypothetical protein NIES4102_41760 [Chondrocystis sp. NIES-4102]
MLNKGKKTNIIELEEKTDLIESKDGNKIILIFFILGISLFVSILGNLALIYLSVNLGTREKIFVTRKGEIEIAQEKDPNFRDEKLIEETVSNWLYLTHEWDSSVPGSSVKDSGVQLVSSNNKYFKVPTKVYLASYLLEIGFRKQYLEELSKSIPSTFYSGKVESNFKLYFIGNTERIDDYLYKTDVIFTRTDVEENVEIAETQINQTIYLQATKPYRLMLGKEDPSIYRKQLNQLLKNGLIIYKVSPNISKS